MHSRGLPYCISPKNCN
ncbi:hypothetical protein Zm00014a_044119 [Zea mays]|uniref:Uncharacterized protein n=1 Tax=Zea mays TaxID=4577 RepID=A0A3L6FDY8_MAIZE|nr:hypothetical protein Zm00014a_044119 [Zea mays]